MEKAIRRKSFLLTLAIHGLLLLALIYLVISSPIPPFPVSAGGGGLVNIGYVEMASGMEQPMSENTTADPVSAADPSKAGEEELITQETEEAVSLPTNVKKNNQSNKVTAPSNKVKNTPNEVRKVDQRALFPGAANNSKSQGSASTGAGDQGDKDGDLSKYFGKNGGQGGNGSGGGEGDGMGAGKGPGVSFDVKGRRILRLPKVDDQSQETGRVVVSITVDKNGNVIAAVPGVKGSTTSSSYLYAKSKEAALKTKFDVKADAAEIQK
ncbi:MAG: hypothetical protein RIQ89_600, partial [Bacteroidota bacterium]